MSIRETLAALARGEPVSSGGLLQTCRLEADGIEHYGAEAIVAAFQIAPLDLVDGIWIETAYAVAVIAPAGALVADLADGRIARLWRPGGPVAPPPDVAVAFDVDLAQAPPALILDTDDFPGLSSPQLETVAAAGRAIGRGWCVDGRPAYRARPIPLRAFASPEGIAALFVVCWTAGEPMRTTAFTPALALLPTGAAPLFMPDPR